MAAKAGKKGKKKGTTMALTDFLSDEQGNVQGPGSSYVLANKSVDWAAEMEELDVYSESAYGTQQAVDRTRLPTAPKASRGPEDMEKVPMEPPFTAFIGNLPYEVSEEKIEDFFKQLQVVNVRLPEENGRFRGFGYVQFETRQALIDALGMNEEILGGRKVRIDLAGQSQHGGNERDGRSGGSRNDDGQPDRTDGDWRRSAPEPSGGSGYDDRGPSRGGFEDRGSSRGFDDRGPSRGFEDRGSSRGFDDRGPSRGFDDRGPSRGFDDRGGDRGFGRRDDRGGGGFGRDRYDDRDGGRRGFGSGFRRDDDRSGGGFDRDRGYGGDRGGDRGFGGDRGGDRGFGGDRGGDRGYRGDRGGDRGFGGDRGGDRSFGGDRGGDRGYGGDRGGDRGYGGDRGGDRGFGGDRDRGFRGDRQDRGFERQDRQETRESEPPKERPRLQLAPRSKPLENTTASEEKSSDKPAAKASIFGNAKPVNTAQRELEIEERLRKQKLDPPAPTKSSVESRYGSSRGGYEDPRGYEEHRDSGRERRYEETTDSRHAGRSDPGSRRRSDSDKSSQDGDSQRERHSSSSSSKGRKGPSRPRKHSGDPVHQSEVTSGGEDHHREDKSYNAVSPAYRDDAHKLVPAPPPKENIWEKRKSTQTVSSPPKSDEPKSPSAQERSQNDTQSYSQSARSPQNSETQNQSSKIPPVQQQTRTTSEETSPSQSKTDRPKDFVPAEPPKENPWLKRKQERDQNTAPGTENHTGPAPAHNTGMPSAWGGRGGGGGERERGRGGRGAYGRGRGNAKPKQEKREKPMPQSLEEMPKYEEKSKKDFSDSNKFAGLIDEDEGGFDEES